MQGKSGKGKRARRVGQWKPGVSFQEPPSQGNHTRRAQFFQPWILTLVKCCLPGKLIRGSVPKVLIRGWSLRYYLPRVRAQSLQSCPTLYDPMDYRPPGSSVHGESPGRNTVPSSRGSLRPRDGSDVSSVSCICRWVLMPREVKSLSRVQLFATPWTLAYQAPLTMGFSRQ